MVPQNDGTRFRLSSASVAIFFPINFPSKQPSHSKHLNASGVQIHGIVLDLRKAFNSLPRLPLWAALLQMGFPRDMLCTWQSFVAHPGRRFRVRSSLGPPQWSNCGFPEGCGLSVFSMLIVDWMLDLWLKAVDQTYVLETFVDDWNVQFGHPSQLGPLWAAVQQFVSITNLDLDITKTFAWSLDAAARAEFRDGPVQVPDH